MPSEEMKMDYCVGGGGQTLRVGVVGCRGPEILVRRCGRWRRGEWTSALLNWTIEGTCT
jgi:hypothetical protein